MKAKHIFYLILLGIASACSGPEEETILPPPPVAAMQNISFRSTTATNYDILAFRQRNNEFVYLKTFQVSGLSEGEVYSAELPVGNYQFLFARNYNTNTLLSPSYPNPNTRFEEMTFITKTDSQAGGNQILGSDELYLQDQHADSVYQLTAASTIECTLKRAVAQLVLHIKRGQKNADGTYTAIPYPSKDNIARYFNEIKIELAGIGSRVNAQSIPSGSANLQVTYAAIAYDSLSSEGFATYTGPFFFPSATPQKLQLGVILTPAANSPQPSLKIETTGAPKRNEQFIVTVWVTKDWNFIGITTDTQPITAEIPGDEGIWDDTVTPL